MLKRKNKTARKQNLSLLFLLPSLAGISIFVLIPFADVIRRSFLTAISKEFIGATNYQSVFQNEAFQLAAKNTLRLLATALPILLLSSLFLALLLYSVVEKAGFFKTAFLLPMAIPVSSVVFLWRVLFDSSGLLNGLIVSGGGTPVNWMNSPTAFWVVVGSFVWKNIGYNIVLWMAGLAAISQSLYEAARVDGAGPIRSFFHITLPGILPSLFTILVLSLVNLFKIFREAWLVAGDYPHSSIYFLQHLFNNWFRELSLEKLSAAAVVVALASLALILLLRRTWDESDF